KELDCVSGTPEPSGAGDCQICRQSHVRVGLEKRSGAAGVVAGRLPARETQTGSRIEDEPPGTDRRVQGVGGQSHGQSANPASAEAGAPAPDVGGRETRFGGDYEPHGRHLANPPHRYTVTALLRSCAKDFAPPITHGSARPDSRTPLSYCLV